MRIADIRDVMTERDDLLAKKRLGRKQKARLATLFDTLAAVKHPLPEPRKAPTGQRADFQGNVYAMHSGKPVSQREARRMSRFGRGSVQPFRSRIQRATRRRRTGGVK